MFKIIDFLLENLINFLIKFHAFFINRGGMRILAVTGNKKQTLKTFLVENPNLKDGRKALHALFNTLQKDPRFHNFCNNKIIIVIAIINGKEYSYHHNVLINNLTSFQEYWDAVKGVIKPNFGEGYGTTIVPVFKVMVWNGDNYLNKYIKITAKAGNNFEDFIIKMVSTLDRSSIALNNYYSKIVNFNYQNLNYGIRRFLSTKANNVKKLYKFSIKPYSKDQIEELSNKNIENLAASDIETMEIDGDQVPVLITYVNKFTQKSFMIDHILLQSNKELALKKLWKEYFDCVLSFDEQNGNVTRIFFHNLGSFDGTFLYKGLLNYIDPICVSTIIDDSNKFITITVNSRSGKNFIFKDSLRIFPMNLASLCKMFNVDGKLSEYNPAFNKLSLFNNDKMLNSFINYGIQDSIALYNALTHAQLRIYIDFKLDICSVNIVSTSSLAFNIFRMHFLKVEIPILNNVQESFIRRGYFGGATDYYKKYATNVKYYDVNSLYPYAMLNDMPGKLIKFYANLSNFNLDNFFGFVLAEVTIPKTLVPLLPYKNKNGNTIFPTGTVIGIYFSEELKALKLKGYSIKLLSGYEFERIENLFTSFINHFYELKKNATGAERALAKLIMNSSYGNFGRKSDLLITKNVHNDDLDDFVMTHLIKTIININENWSTILTVNNLPLDIIKKLKLELDIEFENYKSVVSANVAIAAAITSYARIHMIDLKLNNDIIYSDTDSIIIGNVLDDSLIGPELGQLKDELNGGFMNECYVLGIKQYGYHYNHNDKKIECSVFAGVTRNSINFTDFIKLANGESLSRSLPDRFHKSFIDLSVSINPASVNIQAKPAKNLVGNNYIPPHIIDLDHELDNRSKIIKLIKKFYLYVLNK